MPNMQYEVDCVFDALSERCSSIIVLVRASSLDVCYSTINHRGSGFRDAPLTHDSLKAATAVKFPPSRSYMYSTSQSFAA